MIIVGIDAHKRTHTLVAIDERGQRVGSVTVPATSDGHLEALRWSQALGSEVRFAVEDCRHLTRRLESDLLVAGQSVTRMATRLMATHRRTLRERGKSDPIDALAVALAALREPDLPAACLDGPARELRLLVDHRENLVRERTRISSRIRWHLHELDPELVVPDRGLRRLCVLDQVDEALASMSGMVAEICADLVGQCRDLTKRINELERDIRTRVHRVAPALLEVPGCGPLTAAKIVGETAGIARFRSKAAFARFNGTAPIPVWSSNTEQFRLNRGGNRQVNSALHRIAITQLRGVGPGEAYVERRRASGETKTKAIRALRRRISDVVYSALLADEKASQEPLAAAA
jgi:transposase